MGSYCRHCGQGHGRNGCGGGWWGRRSSGQYDYLCPNGHFSRGRVLCRLYRAVHLVLVYFRLVRGRLCLPTPIYRLFVLSLCKRAYHVSNYRTSYHTCSQYGHYSYHHNDYLYDDFHYGLNDDLYYFFYHLFDCDLNYVFNDFLYYLFYRLLSYLCLLSALLYLNYHLFPRGYDALEDDSNGETTYFVYGVYYLQCLLATFRLLYCYPNYGYSDSSYGIGVHILNLSKDIKFFGISLGS